MNGNCWPSLLLSRNRDIILNRVPFISRLIMRALSTCWNKVAPKLAVEGVENKVVDALSRRPVNAACLGVQGTCIIACLDDFFGG